MSETPQISLETPSNSPLVADVHDAVESPREADSQFIWNVTPKVTACTSNVCTNGHEWVPFMQLTTCPGCKSTLLALKMDQCPQCNEPATHLRLRTDHLPKGGAITPICRGSASLGEINTITLNYQHYTQEQTNHVEREMLSKV